MDLAHVKPGEVAGGANGCFSVLSARASCFEVGVLLP